MKRALIVMAAGALVVPAFALASPVTYNGTVNPSGNVAVHVKNHNGNTTVTNFVFDSVPMTCADGDHTTSGNTQGAVIPVKKGSFSFTGTNGLGATLHITGSFSHRKRQIDGTLRVHGDRVPVDGDGSANGCDTGSLDYTAHR